MKGLLLSGVVCLAGVAGCLFVRPRGTVLLFR